MVDTLCHPYRRFVGLSTHTRRCVDGCADLDGYRVHPNARRCNRTHCRFTGPYYLAMIIPVLALGSGMISAGIYGWIVLGILILGGSKLIWWATERAWGRFS